MPENLTWSNHVQGTQTLYRSRKLRFDDMFAAQYKPLMNLDPERRLSILEVGCGPGALAGALHRWYPKAAITGLDRDSAFIRFAREQEPGITFLEGDATALPFPADSFDVCISNTVSEHIAPKSFFGEQLRVLVPGGVCLLLSSRKGISRQAACLAYSKAEEDFWQKVGQQDDRLDRYQICKYPMDEQELPLAMAAHGFTDITTGFVALNLAPDHPGLAPELARDIINADRHSELDAIASVERSHPGNCSRDELLQMTRLANQRYDLRIAQLEKGQKQWDVTLALVMVIRGVKPLRS